MSFDESRWSYWYPSGMQPGILGAVLAGGESRRMGLDKGGLDFQGRPLALHAAEVLGSVLPEVVVVGGSSGGDGELGVERVADIHRGCGPLGGLHAALHRGAGRPVFVLACDLPLIPTALIRHVVARAGRWVGDQTGPRATAVSLEGRLQPLCGLYAAACLEVAERHLQEGVLSVHEFFEALEGTALPVTADLPFYDRQLLLNVNRPGDLATARCRMVAPAEER